MAAESLVGGSTRFTTGADIAAATAAAGRMLILLELMTAAIGAGDKARGAAPLIIGVLTIAGSINKFRL